MHKTGRYNSCRYLSVNTTQLQGNELFTTVMLDSWHSCIVRFPIALSEIVTLITGRENNTRPPRVTIIRSDTNDSNNGVIYLSIYRSTYLPTFYLPIYLPATCVTIFTSFYIYLSVILSVHLPICVFIL